MTNNITEWVFELLNEKSWFSVISRKRFHIKEWFSANSFSSTWWTFPEQKISSITLSFSAMTTTFHKYDSNSKSPNVDSKSNPHIIQRTEIFLLSSPIMAVQTCSIELSLIQANFHPTFEVLIKTTFDIKWIRFESDLFYIDLTGFNSNLLHRTFLPTINFFVY